MFYADDNDTPKDEDFKVGNKVTLSLDGERVYQAFKGLWGTVTAVGEADPRLGQTLAWVAWEGFPGPPTGFFLKRLKKIVLVEDDQSIIQRYEAFLQEIENCHPAFRQAVRTKLSVGLSMDVVRAAWARELRRRVETHAQAERARWPVQDQEEP